jgi:hypothetical protein
MTETPRTIISEKQRMTGIALSVNKCHEALTTRIILPIIEELAQNVYNNTSLQPVIRIEDNSNYVIFIGFKTSLCVEKSRTLSYLDMAPSFLIVAGIDAIPGRGYYIVDGIAYYYNNRMLHIKSKAELKNETPDKLSSLLDKLIEE